MQGLWGWFTACALQLSSTVHLISLFSSRFSHHAFLRVGWVSIRNSPRFLSNPPKSICYFPTPSRCVRLSILAAFLVSLVHFISLMQPSWPVVLDITVRSSSGGCDGVIIWRGALLLELWPRRTQSSSAAQLHLEACTRLSGTPSSQRCSFTEATT